MPNEPKKGSVAPVEVASAVEKARQELKTAEGALNEARANAAKNASNPQVSTELNIRVKSLEERVRNAEQALAAAEADAARAKAIHHTVAAGETLSHISLKYYKTANRWKEIYEANKDVIGDNHNLIKPGQVLVIPGTES